MVGGQFVPNRHQRWWALAVHSPHMDMAIGHEHVHPFQSQVDPADIGRKCAESETESLKL